MTRNGEIVTNMSLPEGRILLSYILKPQNRTAPSQQLRRCSLSHDAVSSLTELKALIQVNISSRELPRRYIIEMKRWCIGRHGSVLYGGAVNGQN